MTKKKDTENDFKIPKDLSMFYQTTLRNVALTTTVSFAALAYPRFYRDKSKIYTTGMGLVSLLLLLISFSLNFHLYYIVQNYKGIKEFYNTVKLEILNILFMIIHFITIGFLVYTLYKLSLNK
tara:strand:+ start:34 stop:402 length:369 start_codon:yes stop_codon:yes gene_type:complete